jgi:hypothetical protein
VPVKLRTPKARRPQFSDEVLALFQALEQAPERDRDSDEWVADSKRLAGLLGLGSEWWSMCHVNDASRTPCWSEDMPAAKDWHVVHAVREQLLEACAEAEDSP